MSGVIAIANDSYWVVGSLPCRHLFELLHKDEEVLNIPDFREDLALGLAGALLYVSLKDKTSSEFAIFANGVLRAYSQMIEEDLPYIERIKELLRLLQDDCRANDTLKAIIQSKLSR